MGGTKRKSPHKNRRLSLTKIRHLNMLRRAAEEAEEAKDDDYADVIEAGPIDDYDAAVDLDGSVGSAAKDVEGEDTGGATDADYEIDEIYDTVADGDTKRELVIAVRCMIDAGLRNFLKSAVGGSMKGTNLSTCLSRTASAAQYAHEKVCIYHMHANIPGDL